MVNGTSHELGAVLGAMRSSLKSRLLAVCVLAGILGALVFQWRLFQSALEVRAAVRFAHQADSYLPNLADIGPGLLKNPGEAARFLAYYHLVERKAADMPGSQEMLGYCYYYSGDPEKAVQHYMRAVQMQPNSFAARYNLGVIYYCRGDWDKASQSFQDAISLSNQRAVQYVMTAKVFFQLMISQGIKPSDAVDRVRREYDDAKRFMKVCLEKQGKAGQLLVLAARFTDLSRVLSENGGQPSSTELIIF